MKFNTHEVEMVKREDGEIEKVELEIWYMYDLVSEFFINGQRQMNSGEARQVLRQKYTDDSVDELIELVSDDPATYQEY